jgi:AraC-like DNA-binding protein
MQLDQLISTLLTGGIVFICLTLLMASSFFERGISRKLKFVLHTYYFLILILGVDTYLIANGLITYFPYLIRAAEPLYYLYWSTFYLVVKYRLDDEQEFKKWELLLFAPSIISFIYNIPFYLKSANDKVASVTGVVDSSTEYQIMAQTLFSYFIVFFTYRYLRQRWQLLLQYYSDMDSSHIDWASFMLKINAISMISFNLIFFCDKAVEGVMTYFVIHAGTLFFLVIAISICAKLILKLDDFAEIMQKLNNPEVAPLNIDQIEKEIERTSKVSPEERAAYKEKLVSLMTTTKPYLNISLRLKDLADQLGMPAYILSEVINTEFEMNFHDYINQFRIEEAKKRLVDPNFSHLTIIAIANDVGFNSKSVFNTAFKRLTNMTPSEFKRSAL